MKNLIAPIIKKLIILMKIEDLNKLEIIL
jgi:hypothetical protein